MEDNYNCRKCGDCWDFLPEDYNWIEEDYPDTCPLCTIPLTQMVKDVYKEEGAMEVIRRLWIRIIN